MKKNKMIAKGCPKCDQQVPVACKACPCGHSFFNARRTTRVPSPGEDIRRRTQRVRREKPNYYDALEYDKQLKKTKTRSSECDNEDDTKRDTSSSTRTKKRKLKKEDEEEDDIINHLSPEKQLSPEDMDFRNYQPRHDAEYYRMFRVVDRPTEEFVPDFVQPQPRTQRPYRRHNQEPRRVYHARRRTFWRNYHEGHNHQNNLHQHNNYQYRNHQYNYNQYRNHYDQNYQYRYHRYHYYGQHYQHQNRQNDDENHQQQHNPEQQE